MPSRPSYEVVPVRGAPGGMEYDGSPDGIADGRARYLQDVFIDRDPMLERRGPIVLSDRKNSYSGYVIGMLSTRNPVGELKMAIVRQDHGNASPSRLHLEFLSDDLSTSVDQDLGVGHPVPPVPNCSYSTLLGGGVAIGVSRTFGKQSTTAQQLFFWYGADKDTYSPGNVSITQGTKALTGVGTSFLTEIASGSFLHNAAGAFIGVVESVQSDTAATLKDNALYTIAATTGNFRSYRGFYPKIATGVINVASGATTVVGADTKFSDEGVLTNARLYRKKDNLFLGTVSANATDNFALTISASAAPMNGEEYFIINPSPDYDIDVGPSALPKPGWLSTIWRGRQWYASRVRAADIGGSWLSRLWYSDTKDFENVDFSAANGSFFLISGEDDSSDPIVGLYGSTDELLIFKTDSTWKVTGTTPDDFAVKKIYDDGLLTPSSYVEVDEGVMWAGKRGIYFLDTGEGVNNILEGKLSHKYEKALLPFNPDIHRAYASFHRDYAFFSITDVDIPRPTQLDGVNSYDEPVTIAIHRSTMGAVFMSNLAIKASTHFAPAETAGLTYQHQFAVHSASNKITNSNFEVDVTDWFNDTPGGTLTQDNTHVFLGAFAAKSVHATPPSTGMVSTVTYTAATTDSWEISAWVYSDTAGQQIDLGFDEYNGGILVRQTVQNAGTTIIGWKRFKVTLSTGSGMNGVRPRLNHPSGTVWVDDFRAYRKVNEEDVDYVSNICDFDQLFDGEGVDDVATGTEPFGPALVVELRGYDTGDATRRKRWKIILANVLNKGDVVRVATIKGLGDTPEQLSSTFGTSTGFSMKRIKISKATPVFRILLYQPTRRTTALKFGPLALAYTPQRVGRT